MLSNLSAPFTGDKTTEVKEKIDPDILEKNRQLKLDCYNNLSGKPMFQLQQYLGRDPCNIIIAILCINEFSVQLMTITPYSSMFTTDCRT